MCEIMDRNQLAFVSDVSDQSVQEISLVEEELLRVSGPEGRTLEESGRRRWLASVHIDSLILAESREGCKLVGN
jgi:hypothetical protein